ncbi:MAG TPA: ATP-binding protein [Phototrophicaceae bacterium]|nr:ATP-binding protein [Phototrophicaceae bacterium]
MMRSLTFKWLATLLLTSLIGVALIGLLAYRATTTQYDRLRMEQAENFFIDRVMAYYQNHGGWDGLEVWLDQSQISSDPGFPLVRLFALANTRGVIVAGFGPFHTNQRLDDNQLADGIPILVNGKHVATALLAVPPPELGPRERNYLNAAYQALFFSGVVASSAALLIGVLLSRHFLRPLRELAKAITAMKHGDLNQRVEVRSQDELGQLAQTFNQMSAEIYRANQLRKQMTADIAHDLRTPLTVITGYLEGLRDGTLKPTSARFDIMYQETTLLKRLIDDLRTLSLADAGELKLECQPIQAAELLEQVRQSFEPLAAEAGVTLRIQADANLPEIQVDRERLVQVLANLVTNALHYTPAGGSITLGAASSPDHLLLTVTDTGTGIAADKLPNVFERFYRVEESRSQNDGESGLGLAIAKSIVEAHHGTITAESQLGHGTTMKITFPAANCP